MGSFVIAAMPDQNLTIELMLGLDRVSGRARALLGLERVRRKSRARGGSHVFVGVAGTAREHALVGPENFYGENNIFFEGVFSAPIAVHHSLGKFRRQKFIT